VTDTEPVRERRVDVEDIAGDEFATLLIVLDRADRTGALGELDQGDAHVVDHGHQHLADIVALRLGLPEHDRVTGIAQVGDRRHAQHTAQQL
jgi:hypothetical protein